MELNSVLDKVNKLIAKAEHEATEPTEAQTLREAAERLMLKYAIEQADLDAARPAASRTLPDKITFEVGEYGEIIGHIAGLMETIARHCRCMIKHYTSYVRNSDGKLVYSSTLYGYQSDLRYFEILWTSVRLHAIGVLVPGWNKNETEEANAYRLHEAGYNWLEIQQMRGWKKQTMGIRRRHDNGEISDELYEKYESRKAEIWYHKGLDEYRTNWQLGSKMKSAYHRECKRLGEEPKRIPAGATGTFRKSAARGYSAMIGQRLRRMRQSAGSGGSSLMLRADAVRDMFREDNSSQYARCPACQKLSSDLYNCEFCGQFIKDPPQGCPSCKANPSGTCKDHPGGRSTYKNMPFNSAAYAAGARHAQSADLSIGNRVGAAPAKPIG